MGWGHSSVVKHLCSLLEAQDLIFLAQDKNKTKCLGLFPVPVVTGVREASFSSALSLILLGT